MLELEPWELAARGLRQHVRQVAEALGCTGDAFLVQTEPPVSVYLPLEHRIDGRDTALLWDAEHGWAAAVEDDRETRVIAYLGAALPRPERVAAFVGELAAGRPAGCATPPRCPVNRSDLAALHRESRRSQALIGTHRRVAHATNSTYPVNVPV